MSPQSLGVLYPHFWAVTFSPGRLENESGHGTLVSAEQESGSAVSERVGPRAKPSLQKTGVNATVPSSEGTPYQPLAGADVNSILVTEGKTKKLVEATKQQQQW